MAGKTNYLEAQLLNLIFRTQAAWKPAAIYIGLFTVTPSDAGGGTEWSNGRQAVTQADAQWNAPAGTPRSISNVNAITWSSVASGATVVAWGIFDASSTGNLLYWKDITPNKTINAGDTVSFAGGAPGALVVQED